MMLMRDILYSQNDAGIIIIVDDYVPAIEQGTIHSLINVLAGLPLVQTANS